MKKKVFRERYYKNIEETKEEKKPKKKPKKGDK